MFTALILAGNLACSGDTDPPPPPTGTEPTDTPPTDTAPTDTAPTDTAPVLPEICYEYGVADSTIYPGLGRDGAEGAVLIADGVPVWLDGTGDDGSTLFTLDMNGLTDVALFYTERALGDVSDFNLAETEDIFCVAHDDPCDGMSTMRLQLTGTKYAVTLENWPEPVWVVAMDAADAPTCQE